MNRRTALWLTGAAALVLGTVLLAIDDRMWDAGGPGIIGFELAGSEDRAGDILLEWGDDGQDAARLSLWLDFAYLVFYGAFLYLAAAATRDLARARGWARLAAIGRVAVPAAPAAAAFDAAEDIALLVVLGGDGGAAGPVIATAFAGLKFLMLTVVIVYVLAGLVRRAYARSPRAVRLAAIGTGVAVVVLLAFNAWISGRETEAAEADPPGRVLELPGGDIHVREDGARGKPPLVLIHGFACSMRWWDAITPLLAREHRVIRIDLLGHGGSEKPRDGYSMENQADLVAAAMDRMGVARAAVVGHSMGGMVGTALVERHRERVSRLMTIGTPPDLDSAEPSASRRVAGLPVLGPAISRLAPERMVHAEVESTFIPEFDPPTELLDDVERTTWSSFSGSGEEGADYRDARPLDRRLAGERIPVTAVFGRRDSVVDPASSRRYATIPGARIVLLGGLGHSPQVESPRRTAGVILSFAR